VLDGATGLTWFKRRV